MSLLTGWQPDRVTGAGTTLLIRTDRVQRTADDLTAVGTALTQCWSGQAADAATVHTTQRAGEVEVFSERVRAAGTALVQAGEALATARAELLAAVQAAGAAGCTVTDDGTVVPPALPDPPSALAPDRLDAWRTDRDGAAAQTTALVGRLTAQIQGALTAAGQADDTAAAALNGLELPQISPPPVPVMMGLTGGEWGPLAGPVVPVGPATPSPPPQQPLGAPPGRPGLLSRFGHGLLDVAGLIPGFGEPADLLNATWYAVEGDKLNAGLSLAAAAPVVGWGATGAKAANKAKEVAEVARADVRARSYAHSSAQAAQLRRQLASEDQMSQAGAAIIGQSTSKVLIDAPRLARTYGGDSVDWTKMTSSSYQRPTEGFSFETHWYQNTRTGDRVEFKTKLGGVR